MTLYMRSIAVWMYLVHRSGASPPAQPATAWTPSLSGDWLFRRLVEPLVHVVVNVHVDVLGYPGAAVAE